MRSSAAITAVEKFLPERIVTTREIAPLCGQSTEELVKLIGVEERRFAGEEETGSTFAIGAARQLLARRGLRGTDIDFVIAARSDRTRDLEASAEEIKAGIGADRAQVFEARTNCRAVLDALRIGQALIDAGRARRVLIAAGTKQTTSLDAMMRGQIPAKGVELDDLMRGDAGAALLIEKSETGIRVVSAKSIEGDADELDAGHASVARRTVTHLATLIKETYKELSWKPKALKWIVGPQVSANFTRLILEKAGVPGERGAFSIAKLGNTSVAAIPLTLAHVLEMPNCAQGQAMLGAAAPRFGACVLALELS